MTNSNPLPLTDGNLTKYIFDAVLASPKPMTIFVECVNEMDNPTFKPNTSKLMAHMSKELKNFLINYRKLITTFYLQRLDIQVFEVPSQFSSMSYSHPSFAKPAAKNINIVDLNLIMTDCYPDEIKTMSYARVLKTIISATNFKNRNMVYVFEKGTISDESIKTITNMCQDKPNTFIVQFNNETNYE